MSYLRAAPAISAVLLLAGCYHATIETGATPSAVVINKSFASAWIYGLVPPSTVAVREKCPNGVATVETQHSFVNQLVGLLTLGIYTPMQIKVTCAASGPRSDTLPVQPPVNAPSAANEAPAVSSETVATEHAGDSPVNPVAESPTNTLPPTPSSSASIVDAPPPQGEAVASQPPAKLGTGRTNSELLAEPDFNRAIEELRGLKFLAGFQEGGLDTLLVDVSDKAPSTDLSEYNLGRLFSAYYRMTDWSPQTLILFSLRGQVLGAYRRNGLSVRERR